MVRLPISDALWATWKRYCSAAGIPMGRAVVALIVHELETVVEGRDVAAHGVLTGRAEEQLAAREARAADREHDLATTERHLSDWNERLRIREEELGTREQRLDLTTKLAARPAGRKVGRNERCPCGSGLKYKCCHGA
jgi:preprotein translocase subunit SecA